MTPSSPWWDQDAYAQRQPFLQARRKIIQATRQFFDALEFNEVETAILQFSGGNETHISAFATELIDVSGESSRLFLHSSPEFACKKLLAAGERRLFTLARAFRNRERTPLHHPEFTMLEWYRVESGVQALMADCAGLLAQAARAIEASNLSWRTNVCDAFASPETISVCEAFLRYADIELQPLLQDRDGLAQAASKHGLRVAQDDNWSDLFSKILAAKVEPYLGHQRPVFLIDYPVSEAALARAKPDDPRFADRFELYVCGVELANGFVELTDVDEQRNRFETQMREKKRIYQEEYPIDPDFMAALARMPPASGVALGFDRLVMLATHAAHIEQVLWEPVAMRGGALKR